MHQVLEFASNKYLGTDTNISEANGVAGCLMQRLETQSQYNEFLAEIEPELAILELKIDFKSIDGTNEKLENPLLVSPISIVQ